MVTSEGYERSELWLRAKRVMVVFNDTPMEEGSGVFFLILLTSSSLCPHSYGGRFWSVLPHTAHFVIPVSSLTSSSLCSHSLRHPCVLTLMEEVSGVFFLTAHFVIPVSSLLWRKVLECSSSLLTSSSLCPHSLRHPCVLTHFVIPVFSHP